jgi:hypothetical protein
VTSFDFITAEWLDLQTWLTKIRALPGSPAEFEDRYGTFSDEDDLLATEAALLTAQEISVRLGGPADVQLRLAEEPGYLSSETAPTMIYGRLLWWVLRAGASSTAVRHQVESVQSLIAEKQASSADVRALLSGDFGLDGLVRAAADAGRELSTTIGNLQDHLRPQISVFAGTKMLAEANQVLGGLGGELTGLHDQAALDYQVWKHQRLAPGDKPPPIDVTGPSNTTILGFHWPWTRRKENDAQADYATVLTKIDALEAEVRRKAQFLTDVKGLDIAGRRVSPALDQLRSGIGQVVRDLDNFAAHSKATALGSDDQLGDSAWVLTSLQPDAVEALADDARQFMTVALVQTHVLPPAGSA